LGYKTDISLRATLKPLSNLRLSYDLQSDRFYKERKGERVYTYSLLSQRISYQISRALSLRLITDYNDYYGEIYTSLLLSYELSPGRVFYLGIDDNLAKDEAGIFRDQGRYFFIKFSYWWRV
jgi:hypothetical protein